MSEDIHSSGSEGAGGGQTVAEVIIGELVRWGVGVVFGIPGTSSLGVIDAVRKHPEIRFFQVRHEETAAMAASAYHKLTGRVAACVTIAGPGATNLATGLYDAKEDRASVISLNGQVEAQYAGPGGFQEIDQDAFFRPVTVYNNTLHEKTMAVRLVDAAMRHAIVHRGVAQLSIPNDIQKEAVDLACCPAEGMPPSREIAPPDAGIDRAAEAVNRAERPVIIAGWGARDALPAVRAIAERIAAPILTTFRAKGLIPDDDPWHLGILGSVGSAQARRRAEEADLLLAFGVGFSKQTNVPGGKPLVQVDLDPIKLGRHAETVSLWGDCGLVLPRLLERLERREDGARKEAVAQDRAAWRAQIDREADADAVPIRPPFIMQVLSDIVPDDAVITVDVGENGWWFGRNFRMKGTQKFAMSGYLATMGFAMPAAIAAKIAYPDRPTVCITGDGGFSMAMAEFLTAVKYDLPMTVVVLNNHELGMIRVEQRVENYPNFGTELHNPDFAAYARACGGEGFSVERPAELAPAIVNALESGRPAIVDVETDPKRF
jgi:pyruvate oxidase